MRLPTQLLRRRPEAHKGDFGHIFILAGSARFSGAAVLCSEAAMRSGAGLVTLGIPKSLNSAIVKIKPKEVMTFPLPETRDGTSTLGGYKKIKDFVRNVDVLVVGPGLTQNKSTQGLVQKVISKIDKPMVIDADGLNALVGHLDLLGVTRILTPHLGEMARLMGVSIKKFRQTEKILLRNLPEIIKLRWF